LAINWRIFKVGIIGLSMGLLTSCGLDSDSHPWNNPYPAKASDSNILYSSFEERPKHLDPIRSYSSNEYSIIANIYEPPLQYHYLKRPYELVPLTATRLPVPFFLDEHGNRLPAQALPDQIAWSIYDIEIQPGIRYQPHPSLAKDAQGDYRYHGLDNSSLQDIYTLSDFEDTGTRELTAEDYVYQIKRLAHPKTNSPIFGVMAEYIDGLPEYAQRLKDIYEQQQDGPQPVWLDLREHDLPGVSVTGRYSYQVRIKGKYPQFKYWLAMPFFAPMPWEADRFHTQPGMKDRNLTLHWYPIGTGPYMLTENNPNLRMVLQRNPNFHGERYPTEGMPGDAGQGLLADAGKPMPFIDTVVNSLEKESIPRWNKFLQGYYDVSGIASDTFDQAISVGSTGDLALSDDMREKGIKLATAVATSTYYFGFNMLDNVVGHPAGEQGKYLRQAISIAIDYEEYISIFLNGRGLVGQGPLPPGLYGYQEGEAGINPLTHVWKNGRAHRRPLADAQALLVRAGYPDGRHAETGEVLKLYYDTVAQGPDSKAQLNWWRKQFARLGIELIVRPTDYNRFQDKMLKGTAQLFSWGWNADYPDPENFLFLLYGPNGKVEHKGENAGNYNNPAFNRLFEQMKNMDDSPQRLAIIRQITDILREDAPWLWGLHPKSFALYHDWYFNSKPNLMANNTLKYKRIDPQLRTQKRNQWNQPVTWPIWLLLAIFVISAAPAFVSYRRRQRARPQFTAGDST
jgi:ABC-type transport system substrate-binding protein